MPAFRGKNLRSGDISEQLGTILLQNVALVAPIPRTEDVGIDLVATLLRDFDKSRYIAEDSFFVQLKSESVDEIKFSGEQVKWLIDLELPFFVASINKQDSSISLYSTYHLNDVLVTNANRTEIILDLNSVSLSEYDCSDESASIRIPMGPKVINWSIKTLSENKNFQNEFYKLLKAHIKLMKKGIESRRVGVIGMALWKSNEEPIIWGTKIKPSPCTSEKDEIIAPYLNSLLQDITLGKDLFLARSLYRLLEKKLEREGHFTNIDGKRELIPFQANINLDK